MALINCIECNREVSDRAAACPHCGAPVAVGFAGSATAPTVHAVQRVQVVQIGKNRSTAVLLAIFLGGIGVHKFYLDRPGWGIIYLMFCWTFVPAVLGFIEGLLYLTLDDVQFQTKYGAANAR